MAKVLEFDELPEGAQVMVATQSGGNLIGKAVEAGGGSGFAVSVLSVATDANLTFNGDGSGGAQVLTPFTIVFAHFADLAGISFKLDTPGVQEGWIVAFNIEGNSPGAIQILDQDDGVLANVDDITTAADFARFPFPVCFFNANSWWLLRSDIHNSTLTELAARSVRRRPPPPKG
jgi:hypothetical protein